MPDDTIVVRGRWVVTEPVRGDDGVQSNAAVLVEQGRVTFVGSVEDARARAPGAPVMGDERHIVLPGLINTHHHGRGITALQLGVLDDYLEPWLVDWRTIKPLDAYLDTVFGAMQLIKSGVTTVVHSGVARDYGAYAADTRAHLRAYADIGIRTSYGVQILDEHLFTHEDDQIFLSRIPAQLRHDIEEVSAELGLPDADSFEALITEMFETYNGHDTVRVLAAPVGPDWCSDDLLARAAAIALDAGSGLHMHCLESPFQRMLAATRGEGSIQRLHRLGVLGPATSLGHSVWLDAEGARIVAAAGSTVCHSISSNVRLRSGILPLYRLLEAGVNVALGTDGITLNDDDDMLQELRLVLKLHRLPRGTERVWAPSAADVLRMATTNGARPTLWGDGIGHLLPGAQADLVLVDYAAVEGIYMDPRVRPLDVVINRASQRHVDAVLVGGRLVYENGRFPGFDEAEIAKQLREIAQQDASPLLQRWFVAMRATRSHVEDYYSGLGDSDVHCAYQVNALS